MVTQLGPRESQRKMRDNGSRGHREIRRCYAVSLEAGARDYELRDAGSFQELEKARVSPRVSRRNAAWPAS